MQEQSKPQAPAVPRLTDFPRRGSDTIRFADLDPQGHVNHAKFATYMETSRAAIIRDPGHSLQVEGATSVMARLEIDYMHELRWPGTVEIGTASMEFGRSSFAVGQVIFNDGACAASGRFTMVLLDKSTRRPRPLTEEVIAKLSQWKYRGAS